MNAKYLVAFVDIILNWQGSEGTRPICIGLTPLIAAVSPSLNAYPVSS